MQKIDKSEILSQNYKAWLDKNYEKDHEKYSSSHKYWNDIRMSLLYCQKGLCAYTEELLCDTDLITKACWDNEKYIGIENNDTLVNGDLEHFNCSLKESQGYLWDNLFMVNSNINCRVKGTRTVNDILKPDNPNYSPKKFLQFDYEENLFIANIHLDEKTKEDVNYMIDTLGLNKNAFKRKKQIKELLEDFEFGETLKKPEEYPTSWSMTLESLKESTQ